MALNLAGLTSYVDENRLPLIRKAALGAKSLDYFQLQTGVVGPTALNILNTAIEFGDGTTCGWNEAGQTTFSQRLIEPGLVKINMSFCDKTMAKYWMANQVNIAAGRATLPFEEEFAADVIDGVANKLEKMIWDTDTVVGTQHVKGILGLAAADRIEELPGGATVYESVLAVYKKIPADSLNDEAIFLGIDAFRDLVIELTAKNLYHYNPQVDANLEIVLPGTNTKVIGVAGLNGKKKIVALNPKHVFYGTDMEGDEEVLDFWYSKDNQEFRLNLGFSAGIQYAFPNEVIVSPVTAG